MWNNPESGNVAGTIIVRKEGLYPGSPSDGQVIYQGNSSTFTDTSLQNGKTYYYTAYSYTAGGQYSNPIHISTTPQAGVGQVQLDENPVLQPALAAQHFPADMKFGDKNLEVVHLQQILNTVNVHPTKLTTGYFGPLTVSALKTFQAKYNLPQTGAADAATRVVLDSLSQSWMIAGAPNGLADLTVDLKRGDSGQDVADLQEFLDYEGSYEEGIISGTYGPLTQESVADFQTKHGVTPVSGYVGYKTRHTIQTVLGL
jgi:peptidoglycan hydrolase-like protein with peptidoglycan-binding domain